MGNDSLRFYVQRITELPTLPVIAQKILKMVSNDMTSVGTLEDIIENDPSIAAKILSVANSAFFGFSSECPTISNAIMRIGFDNVKNIALGVSLMSVLKDGKHSPEFDFTQIYKHSVTVGLVAGKLSKELKVGVPEEIFINGILHDIGFLVLYRYFSDTYQRVMEENSRDLPLLDAEVSVLEFTHAEIGAWLIEQWKLPESVFYSTRHHHTPSMTQRNSKTVALIHIADYITEKELTSAHAKDPEYPLDQQALEIIGLSQKDMVELGLSLGEDVVTESLF